MRPETMRATERLEAAFALENPDRVPVVPNIEMDSISRWLGRKQSEWIQDRSWILPAIMDCFFTHGPWDAPLEPTAAPPFAYSISDPMKISRPGIELPDDYPLQFNEEPVLQVEDYLKIADTGWMDFWRSDYVFRIRDIEPADLPGKEAWLDEIEYEAIAAWREKGIEPVLGGVFNHPFFVLSEARSLVEFTKDLYYSPDSVEAALRKMVPETIAMIRESVQSSGIRRVMLVEERASGYFYPPTIFERFWWPYTRQIVETIWSEGILSIWHLDCPWDKELQYFKQLPRGSVCLALDGTTDIFLAKETLGGHVSIGATCRQQCWP